MKASRLFKLSVRRSLFSALILALLCSLLPSGSVSAAGIDVTVTPGRPGATLNDGVHAVTFGFEVTYNSVPSYAILFVGSPNTMTTNTFCRFYDMNGLHGGNWTGGGAPTLPRSCNNPSSDRDYINTPAANTPPSSYSKSGISFTVPNTFASGVYDVWVYYYYDNGGGGSGGGYESRASTTFIVADEVTTITLRNYHDVDRDGVVDAGETLLTTPAFSLCLTDPYTFEESCGLTSGGIVSWSGVPTGEYSFREVTQTGWTQSKPSTASVTDTVTTAPYTFDFANHATSTATNLSSFSAAPEVNGVALTWWANGADTVAFKIKSKPEGSSVFSDVPGGFVLASDPAGKEYAFVDATAQVGTTQYQLIPVDSSGKEGTPVELTAGYHKVFLPRILRK